MSQGNRRREKRKAEKLNVPRRRRRRKRSLSRGSKKGVFLVLKLRVSIGSKVDHDCLVSSKMEKPL